MCRNVEACMCGCAPSVTVIVCETLWCDHLLEDLLCYQTYTPSASLSPLLSHYSILTIWYCCTLCVRHLIQELKIQQDIRQPETSRYQNTKHPIYSLTKKLKSQSPACSRQFIPPPLTPRQWEWTSQRVREPAEPGLIHWPGDSVGIPPINTGRFTIRWFMDESSCWIIYMDIYCMYHPTFEFLCYLAILRNHLKKKKILHLDLICTKYELHIS